VNELWCVCGSGRVAVVEVALERAGNGGHFGAKIIEIGVVLTEI
jgi:hypothetical protein